MQSLAEQWAYFHSWPLQGLPDWVALLCISLIYSWTLGVAGLVALRIGRGPFWALLLILPYFGYFLAWLIAFTVWPRDRKMAESLEGESTASASPKSDTKDVKHTD